MESYRLNPPKHTRAKFLSPRYMEEGRLQGASLEEEGTAQVEVATNPQEEYIAPSMATIHPSHVKSKVLKENAVDLQPHMSSLEGREPCVQPTVTSVHPNAVPVTPELVPHVVLKPQLNEESSVTQQGDGELQARSKRLEEENEKLRRVRPYKDVHAHT